MAGEAQKDDKVKYEIDFPRCPHCGSTETVMREAWKAVKGGIAPGLHLSVKASMTPLTENIAMVLSLPFAPVLMVYYDICANPGCGIERPVRAEVRVMDSGKIAAVAGLNAGMRNRG